MASSSVRVFVSHHHSPDEDTFTARLVADLEAAGADVWVDDARITSDDFIKKINEIRGQRRTPRAARRLVEPSSAVFTFGHSQHQHL